MITPSGLEMLMRSMGMGEAMDAAKELAQSGAVQKLIKFADGLDQLNDQLNERIDSMNARLQRIEQKLDDGTYERTKPRSGSHYDGLEVS